MGKGHEERFHQGGRAGGRRAQELPLSSTGHGEMDIKTMCDVTAHLPEWPRYEAVTLDPSCTVGGSEMVQPLWKSQPLLLKLSLQLPLAQQLTLEHSSSRTVNMFIST